MKAFLKDFARCIERQFSGGGANCGLYRISKALDLPSDTVFLEAQKLSLLYYEPILNYLKFLRSH